MDPTAHNHNDVRASGEAAPLAVALEALQPVVEQLALDAGLTFSQFSSNRSRQKS